jgi:restriction endonuclease S subunit
MSEPWPLVPLGEMLSRSEEWVNLDPEATYSEITVRLWGKGVVLRGKVTGAEIAATQRLVVRKRQFLISRIDARNGASGLVPDTLDGAVVSNDFPAFSINATRLAPEFLDWLSKTKAFVELCKAASEGTTNRVRLKEDRFLATKIPLPLLAEQRRTVARIEALAEQIGGAKRLREEATAEASVVYPSALGSFFSSLAPHWPVQPLGNLCSTITDGPHLTPVYVPEGIPFVTVKNMVSGKLDFRDLQYITPDDHAEFCQRCKPERGDVLYSKDGATRGRPCLVDTDREFSIFVSVALIKPLRDALDGRYLCHLLNSTWIKDRMSERSRGDMIPHIVLREIRAFPVPLPPLLYFP